jgi:hypothetical protein
MKEAIAKREKDFAVGIQKYAENAKRAQAMDDVLKPYESLFTTNGGPQNTIKALLSTGATLQMGSPMQKVNMVAQIIKEFGVDVPTLDQVLVGEQPEQPPAGDPQYVQQVVQQAVQQAVAPYQQAQQQAVQQSQQQVQNELVTFATNPKNEFYHDVKLDMADILDLAAQRGLELSLEDAYERACLMNPEVSRVMNSRTQQQQVQRKRRASVSVSGSPAGPGAAPDPANLRGAIEAAWDNVGRT